jgi:hypothetical protein
MHVADRQPSRSLRTGKRCAHRGLASRVRHAGLARADLSADAAGAPLVSGALLFSSPFGFGDEGLVVGDLLEFVGGVVCANAKVVALNAIKATRADDEAS